MVFHVEVNFSSFPFITHLREDGADQPQEGCFVGKKTGHASPPFEFLVDAFERITGAQAALVIAREGEGGEALRQIFFHPSS